LGERVDGRLGQFSSIKPLFYCLAPLLLLLLVVQPATIIASAHFNMPQVPQ
jgi:hypothetical protein